MPLTQGREAGRALRARRRINRAFIVLAAGRGLPALPFLSPLKTQDKGRMLTLFETKVCFWCLIK